MSATLVTRRDYPFRFCAILVVAMLLGCGRTALRQSVDTSSNTSGQETCNRKVQASLLSLSPYVYVGEYMYFELTISGCSGEYTADHRELNAGTYYLRRAYAQPAVGEQLSVQVVDRRFPDEKVRAISNPFSIIAQETNTVLIPPLITTSKVESIQPAAVECSATSERMSAELIQGLAQFSFHIMIRRDSASVVRIQDLSGGSVTGVGDQVPTDLSQEHSLTFSLSSPGQHLLEFTVSDDNQFGRCHALVDVMGTSQDATTNSSTQQRKECSDWPKQLGFYKDLWVDGGYQLSNIVPTAAAEILGLRVDSLLSNSQQNAQVVGNNEDLNGVLLYPDGSPRYRTIFVNGGASSSHGDSLGQEGRSRFKAYFENGGSYTGSCAGAYLASKGRPYFGLWQNSLGASGILNGYHDAEFTASEHPFVKILSSFGETLISDIHHQGGPYFKASSVDPQGTEYIGKVTSIGGRLKNSPYLLSYKPADSNSGRLVIQPSHPEYAKSGSQAKLMAAILQYSMDGNREIPQLKGQLENNLERRMTSADQRIGEAQYHRWTIEVPSSVRRLTISLGGLTQNADLYVAFSCPSHERAYDYKSTNASSREEVIEIDNPAAGTWHISVLGNHAVANGTSYVLKEAY